MRIPPLFPYSVMLVIGVIVGSRVSGTIVFGSFVLSMSACFGVSTLLFLLLSFFRRSNVASYVFTLMAAMALGAYLIKGERHEYDFPFQQEIEQFMTGQRMLLVETYRDSGLTGDEQGVVAAMTLGEKQTVSHELRESYNVSGASHVFALSGLHLGIIYMLLSLLFPRRLMWVFGEWRRVAEWLLVSVQLLALWAYVMLVGAHPSILRAAVMLTVYGITRNSSRRPDSLSVLVFTLTLLLVIWPQWIFDIGFQMSFAAVASITLLYQPLNRWLMDISPLLCRCAILRVILQTMLISTCAQLGVAPLIAHYFHRFSVYFLLTNLPVPFLATLVIYLAVVLLACASLSIPALTTLVAVALHTVVSWLNRYLVWVSSLPCASIDNISIGWLHTIVIYILIICLCLLAYNLKKGIRRRLG